MTAVFIARTSVLLLILFMLFSVATTSFSYAYFKTEHAKVSAGLAFLVYNQGDSEYTNAGLALFRPFLFEEEEYAGIETMPDDDGTLIMSALQSPFNAGIRQPAPGESVEAEITIPGSFGVERVFIPSVKLHYEDKTWFALNGRIIDTVLVVSFDFYELYDRFREDLYICNYINLIVSGEGYRTDGSIFFFSGETTLQLLGKYDIRETVISGPDVVVIPSEETVTCQFTLVDQDGLILTGAVWTLSQETEGVQINNETGELSAEEEAAGHTIMVEAVFESQGRLHLSRKEVQLSLHPEQEITDGETGNDFLQVEGSDPLEGDVDGETAPPEDQGKEYPVNGEDELVAIKPEDDDEVNLHLDSEVEPDSGGGGAETSPAATENGSENMDL
jgi:hypothetical protein